MAQAAIEVKRGRIDFRGHRRGRKGLSISDDANAARLGKILAKTQNLDFASIAANTTSELTVSVPGATTANGRVSVTPANGIEAGLVVTGYVSAANTVTVRVGNVTVGAINPAARDFHILVFELEP